MPTEAGPALFGFAPAKSRRVMAGFGGGAAASRPGAPLLGITDHGARSARRIERSP